LTVARSARRLTGSGQDFITIVIKTTVTCCQATQLYQKLDKKTICLQVITHPQAGKDLDLALQTRFKEDNNEKLADVG